MNRREANEKLVAELLQARDAGRVTLNPSQFGFELTLGRAYQVGHALHERLVARGFVPIGRKVGFTNRTMWERFSVSEPIWSHIYEQTVQFARHGVGRLSVAGMVSPRLEPEIVFKLRRPVPSGEPSVEDLARCIEWAALGFEIVDCHYADWSFTAAEAVADFGVHAALVVGTPWRVAAEEPLRVAAMLETLKVTLRGGQAFCAEGEGRNALGSPLLVVSQLARLLVGQPWSRPLTAGELITTGTLTALPSVRSGESYRAEVFGATVEPLTLEFVE